MAEIGQHMRQARPAGRERRRFPRQPIELQAQFYCDEGPSLQCVVRDFCPGGMLIRLRETAPAGTSLSVSDTGTLRCALTFDGRTTDLSFRVRIAHIGDHGTGLAFIDPNPSALQRLQAAASHNPPPASADADRGRDDASSAAHRPVLAASARRELLAGCNDIVRGFIEPLMMRFQETVAGDLLDAADAVAEVAAKNAHFEASVTLGHKHETLARDFAEALERRLRDVGRPPASGAGDSPLDFSYESLRLVEDEEFDDWLRMTDFADTVEHRCREALIQLRQRMAVVLDEDDEDEPPNPYGPEPFAQAFREALDRVELKPVMLATCYKTFKRAFMSIADDLYGELNRFLIEREILPDLRLIIKKPPRSAAGADASSTSAEETPEPAGPTGAQTSTENAPPAAGGTAPAGGPTGTQAPPSTGGPGRADGAARQDLYRVVGALRELQRRLDRTPAWHGGAGPGPGPQGPGTGAAGGGAGIPPGPQQPAAGSPDGGAPASPQPAGVQTGDSAASGGAPAAYSAEELLQALSSKALTERLLAAGDEADGRDLRARIDAAIAEHAEGPTKAIGPREGRVIDVADDVFGSLLDDQQVSRNVRSWLKQLEVPVLKMALVDEGVFADKTHIVRQVINKLAELGVLADDDDEQQRATVNRAFQWLVDLVNKEFDGTPRVFERTAHQLDLLIKAQHKLHEQNLAQVTAESLREHGESKQSVPEARVILEQEEADEWVRRVQRISEGDWVLFEAFSEEPLRLKVAWIAVRTSKYIFVNALGKKERMLSADELVALLRGGSAILLDDAGEPAMDRAQFTMLQRLHRQLLHLASHDPLTGLINRGELERHVERMLTDAKVDGSKHALCLLDIDQFQVVNTTCGYEGGDALLKEVVSLLEQNLADTDVLARVGPDQFGLLLVNRSIDDALQVVEDQLARLEDYRFTWSEERISPTMSVGLTGISAQTGTVSEALQAAESSCDVAKQMGGDRIQIYYSQHAGVSRRRQDMRWAARIDRAVDEGGLFLRCQKIAPVDEQSHPRPHYELLLGLSDPLGKQEDLQAFIKAAEHHKRMIELDRWVIHNAFERITAHERELVGIESFAINLSGASLNDDRLFNYICEQLKTTGVPTDRICFEITETAGITNMSDAADFIETIKSIGCRFALDDFGNGMSSYGYLKNLAVDYLKIDGHFIEGVAGSENDQAVVKSICEIAHFMDKAVVAECVQDEAAYAVLKDIGVDYVQGYGVEPPQRLDALLES